jgi:hypothetical protein
MKTLAFPWQLCIGTAAATAVCLLGNSRHNLGDGNDHVEY